MDDISFTQLADNVASDATQVYIARQTAPTITPVDSTVNTGAGSTTVKPFVMPSWAKPAGYAAGAIAVVLILARFLRPKKS